MKKKLKNNKVESEEQVFKEMVDLIDKSGINDMPHFYVQADIRHKRDYTIFKLIHKRLYHTLWEAKTIADMIQRNFLKTLNETNEIDKDLRYSIEVLDSLEGDTFYWENDYKNLEFRHFKIDESLDDTMD